MCYYEMLQLERDCTQEQIEKAYKKAALKLHPDKNRDRDTTHLFQACQEAYTILSDPHERQWYDDHREQILSGIDPENAKEEDSSMITPQDLIKYVNPHCYPGGFDINNKDNFYQVYRELFIQIDKEEELEEDIGTDHILAPNFGDSGTYIEDVLAFYRFWEVFSTKKEFTYADKYNTKDAQNGRERRFVKAENRKERQIEKKKFNQNCRDVLEFIRKRDPRIIKYKKEKEEEKARKKAVEAEKKRKLEEAHQKRREEYREKLRQEYEQMEEEMEEVVEIQNNIICEICNKNFKTEGAFNNHIKSKKHKQKVAQFAKVKVP